MKHNEFGDMVHAYRIQAGKTLVQLGKSIRQHRVVISLVESGARVLNEKHIPRLAKALGCTEGELRTALASQLGYYKFTLGKSPLHNSLIKALIASWDTLTDVTIEQLLVVLKQRK